MSRQVTLAVSAGQLRAAQGAQDYVGLILSAQGFAIEEFDGEIISGALAGIAADGRSLGGLFEQVIVGMKTHLNQGVSPQEAMDAGLRQLQLMVETQILDAGRVADGIATVTQRRARGYVRVLTPPSCGRCAILAGRIYASERPFQRHPRCDCMHVAVGDKAAGEAMATDVRSYFHSLSPQQQVKAFTKAGAEAIRDGADPARVVNARRGMYAAGDQNLTFTRALARRGQLRPTPETIYRLGSDREEILRLLRRYGYIT